MLEICTESTCGLESFRNLHKPLKAELYILEVHSFFLFSLLWPLKFVVYLPLWRNWKTLINSKNSSGADSRHECGSLLTLSCVWVDGSTWWYERFSLCFLQMLDPLSMSSPENSASGSCPSLDSPLDRSGPQYFIHRTIYLREYQIVGLLLFMIVESL